MNFNKTKLVFFIVLTLLLLVLLPTSNPESLLNAEESPAVPSLDDVQKNKFEFLQSKWRSYMESWLSISGEYKSRSARNGEYYNDSQVSFVVSYPEYLEESALPDKSRYVSVNSKKYAVTLRQEPSQGDSKSAFEIMQISSPHSTKGFAQWKFPFLTDEGEQYDLQNPAYSVYLFLGGGLRTFTLCYSLPALLAQEDLTVNQIEWGEYENQRALHINVSLERESNADSNAADAAPAEESGADKKSVYSLTGDIWLDAEFYLMLHGEFKERNFDRLSERKIDCAYQAFNGTPIPTKIRWSNALNDDADKVFSEEFYDYANIHKTTRQDKKRLLLSYYGLPEPKLDDASSIRYFMTAIGCVILFGAIVFSIKRARKEKATL